MSLGNPCALLLLCVALWLPMSILRAEPAQAGVIFTKKEAAQNTQAKALVLCQKKITHRTTCILPPLAQTQRTCKLVVHRIRFVVLGWTATCDLRYGLAIKEQKHRYALWGCTVKMTRPVNPARVVRIYCIEPLETFYGYVNI